MFDSQGKQNGPARAGQGPPLGLRIASGIRMESETTPGRRYLFLAGALALAAALRFYKLGAQPLWLDEATTANYAGRGVLGAITAEATHPPLFYLLESVVVRWLDRKSVV